MNNYMYSIKPFIGVNIFLLHNRAQANLYT